MTFTPAILKLQSSETQKLDPLHHSFESTGSHVGKFACPTASQQFQGCTTQPSSEASLLPHSVQAPLLFLSGGSGATPLLRAPARVPLQQQVSGPGSPQPSMSGHRGHRLSHILLTIHVEKLCRARALSAPDALAVPRWHSS